MKFLRLGRWIVRRTDEWSTEELRAQLVQALDDFTVERRWVEGWEAEETFHGTQIERRVPRGPALLVEEDFVASKNPKVIIFRILRRGSTLEAALDFGKGAAIDVSGLDVRLQQMFSTFDRLNRE